MTLLYLRRATGTDNHGALLTRAREALATQALALEQVAGRLDEQFCAALNLLLACEGRVVVSGVGKSGIVGRKLAATFSSSGTPSYYLHAGEAAHGDLGAVTADDVVVLVSNSGETEELVEMLPRLLELGTPIIAVVGNTQSAVARAASVVIDVSVSREMCPHNLVATTSALATLAVGDALAVVAMEQRGFSAHDFARCHPRGALGRRLQARVSEVMARGDLPLESPEVRVREALITMSSGRRGLVVLIDAAAHPLGIITDGDLRRGLQDTADFLNLRAADVMTAPPVTIRASATLHEAKERMQRLRIKALVVVDDENRVVGVVDIFDD